MERTRNIATRLCLVADAGPGLGAQISGVEKAVDAAGPATLIVAPGEGGVLALEPATQLVKLAQARGIAALIQDDTQLALKTGADGVHLAWRKDVVEAYQAARQVAGADLIVGADAGRSRHDAMELGDLGADYVGFGIPPHVGGREEAAERRLALIQWWAEIFNVPAVAFDVETAEDAARLASAGADFVGARIPTIATAEDAGKWATELAHAVERSGAPA